MVGGVRMWLGWCVVGVWTCGGVWVYVVLCGACVGRCACEVYGMQRCIVEADDVCDRGVGCVCAWCVCDGRYGVYRGGVCQWCGMVKVHVW